MNKTAKKQWTVGVVLVPLLFLFMYCGGKEQHQARPVEGESPIYAFVNVNLVPMTSDTVLEGMTVITKNQIIEKIGKNRR